MADVQTDLPKSWQELIKTICVWKVPNVLASFRQHVGENAGQENFLGWMFAGFFSAFYAKINPCFTALIAAVAIGRRDRDLGDLTATCLFLLLV
jgi:hypothetical protein